MMIASQAYLPPTSATASATVSTSAPIAGAGPAEGELQDAPAPIELSGCQVVLSQLHLYSDGGIDLSADGRYLFTCAQVHVPPPGLWVNPATRREGRGKPGGRGRGGRSSQQQLSPQSHPERLGTTTTTTTGRRRRVCGEQARR
mmetsp:Transcript_5846/g.9632  ORF Transcript_5846/g.9632 Transcript_5846/m.9632 type:complete len:144 (-) Transcript_5846:154-585(-)